MATRSPMSDILDQLTDVLTERRHGDPEASYVASLHHRGLNKVLEKVGEEATEAILAAKDLGAVDPAAQERPALAEALVGETADLWFHSLVMLHHLGLRAADVEAELARRFGIPGLEEKAARPDGEPR